jgi:RNA polymerase sigma-70 factor (ECF subfamily)
MRELMSRYQAGELVAFEELYERLAPRLRGWLAKQHMGFGAELEDLLQECFVQIHRSRHTYLPGLPVEPWAWAIARHVYLMDRRSRRRRRGREVGEPRGVESGGGPGMVETLPERSAGPDESAERRQLIARSLTHTTARRRASVVLHHLFGFSFREVGRILGVSAGAAKRGASRGVADLRESVSSEEDDVER